MKRIDIEELFLHLLEYDENSRFISNYQMYLMHNYLLQKHFLSDFNSKFIGFFESHYSEDVEIVEIGVKINNPVNLRKRLSYNLSFSKNDELKAIISEVWENVKDAK